MLLSDDRSSKSAVGRAHRAVSVQSQPRSGDPGSSPSARKTEANGNAEKPWGRTPWFIATFIANKKQGGDPASYSFVLRGYVRHWLGNVWSEYDRVGLTDIVDVKEETSKAPVSRLKPVMKVAETT